jgi:hypothetical protein
MYIYLSGEHRDNLNIVEVALNTINLNPNTEFRSTKLPNNIKITITNIKYNYSSYNMKSSSFNDTRPTRLEK